MKCINKISLRMRVSLLAGTILIICSVILTVAASNNARIQFEELAITESFYTQQGIDPIIVDGKYITSEDGGFIPATLSPVTAARKQFDASSIIILTVVCLLGMGMVYTVAGRSLRPLNQLSETISSITESDLQYRIKEERNDEVGVLAHSFNIMLNRLEASFLRQKRFAANVAHELKTPLATISAGIQVLNLEENPSASDCREALATTERNAKRLMAIVDDLMRLCDEQETFDTKNIALNDMLISVCDELNPLLMDKQVETKFDCHIHDIQGNPSLLYRVFFNLIENAIKYNKHGGKVTIESHSEDNIGEIIITDTGDGIPKDETESIFEPFYCVDKSRSRKTGGAGLGLSIVKMIIEKHGWEITVDSVLGVGSVFTIKFPM